VTLAMQRSRILRLLLIAACVVLFAGAIAYSLRSVRYSVYGKPETELTVTKLSLTHRIERRQDGKFSAPRREQTDKRSDKACPT